MTTDASIVDVPGGPKAPGALDKRLNAYRPDLASSELEGKVTSRRFVKGERAQVARGAVALRSSPSVGQGFANEVLFGELLTIYDEADGWAWVQLERDRYVGYVPADALTREIVEPTHRVKAVGTFLYPAPDIKSPPLMHLSLNAALAVKSLGERFAELETGGYVVARHITERHRYAPDFVDIAERLIGVPYLWGGRTRVGLDCSGLVQLALEAAGRSCPRDSDMQQATLGADVLVPSDLEGLQRGDLVFWRGHVGVMSDGMMLVHANAYHMAVVAEPLAEAVARIGRTGGPICAIKRLTAEARIAA